MVRENTNKLFYLIVLTIPIKVIFHQSNSSVIHQRFESVTNRGLVAQSEHIEMNCKISTIFINHRILFKLRTNSRRIAKFEIIAQNLAHAIIFRVNTQTQVSPKVHENTKQSIRSPDHANKLHQLLKAWKQCLKKHEFFSVSHAIPRGR